MNCCRINGYKSTIGPLSLWCAFYYFIAPRGNQRTTHFTKINQVICIDRDIIAKLYLLQIIKVKELNSKYGYSFFLFIFPRLCFSYKYIPSSSFTNLHLWCLFPNYNVISWTSQGSCSYVLARERRGLFSVTAENVPCGSTGVTCTKSVYVTVGKTRVTSISTRCWNSRKICAWNKHSL